MWVGIGVGIGRNRFATGIFGAYESRVIADGGVVEAGQCVDAVTGLLLNASLLLIPSGYKANKLYSEIPTNGNGDFTWARTSTANRTNSSGNIELMATGVPRLSYMYGSCPSVLLEPQRTNTIRNSVSGGASAGSPGNLPTNWNFAPFAGAGLTRTIVGVGTENGLPYIDIRLNGTATGNAYSIFTDTTNPASASQVFANSVYLKFTANPNPPNSTSISTNFFNGATFVNSQTTSVAVSTNLTRFTGIHTASSSTVTVSTSLITFNFTIGTAYDFTIRIASPQMELGAFATTWIPTSGTSATRVADSYSRDNIFTNSLITSSGGTWFIELRNNIVYTRDNASSALFINTGPSASLNDGFRMRVLGTSRFAIDKIVAGVSTSLYTTTTDTTKLIIKWNGTSADIFANGTKVVSATAFTTTAMEYLNGTPQVPIFIQQMALFSTPLSDTNCTTLTT